MPGHWLLARMGKRVLRPGGIQLARQMLDALQISSSDTIMKDVSEAIHVNARPLTVSEWRQTLEFSGLTVDDASCVIAPMHLLEPRRVLADEGIFGTARIAFFVLRTPAARIRILQMRRIFRRYENHLCAVMMIGHRS